MGPLPRRAAAGLLFLALAGCGPGPDTPWVHLARALPPGAGDLSRTLVLEERDGRSVRLEPAPDGAWIRTELRREDWVFRPGMELWGADVPIFGVGAPPDGSPPQKLLAENLELSYFPISKYTNDTELPAGAFLARRGRILLALGPDAQPPPSASLCLYVARGRNVDGAWRVRGRRFSGEGLSIWPGESCSVPVRIPPGSQLHFATCVEPVPGQGSASGGPVSFLVEVDGERLFEHSLESGDTRAVWHTVDLGQRSGEARIRLGVEGAWAYTAFLSPRLAPRAAPSERARPDLVVFLADTFRADNMRTYGGELDITPELDRHAARSLRFQRAWSVATRTLPAHASIFGGVFPRQAGVEGAAEALPEELLTVAEVLSAAGYRTGAVTDSVILSQKFGMDQGFEWFDEEHAGFESTLERVRHFLDADDGRPLFLFVQSYRAHTPYVASERARATVGERLGLEGEFEAWSERLKHEVFRADEPDLDSPLAREVVGQIERHYRAAVNDLDHGFAGLRAELEARGLLEDGYFVVTSDHGEAFREHDALYHGGRVWEELLRIPLLVSGPGIEPGDVQRPVSLVDLPPTLVAWAGLAPPQQWVGRSLLESAGERRPVLAFQCWRKPAASTVAVIDGEHKIIGSEDLELLAREGPLFAFDLGRDPGESENLANSELSWPDELLRRSLGALEAVSTPLHGTRAAELDPEKMAELRAMGYGD